MFWEYSFAILNFFQREKNKTWTKTLKWKWRCKRSPVGWSESNNFFIITFENVILLEIFLHIIWWLTQISCLFCQVYLDITHDDPEERWPKKIYYGQNNCIKFSYTRRDKPILKVRSARYCCKSYRTYCCTARLEIKEIGGKDCYTVVGEHSTNCYAMNGVKPTKHYDERDDSWLALIWWEVRIRMVPMTLQCCSKRDVLSWLWKKSG